jgi:hypothetical protein
MSEAFVGARRFENAHPAAPGAAAWLSLAAAPTFAVMALLTGVSGAGPERLLCSAAGGPSALGGMALMYLLMVVFHLPPWLKLTFGRPMLKDSDPPP